MTTAFAVAQHSSELEQMDEGDLLQMDIDIRIVDMADGEPDSGYEDMAAEVRNRVQVMKSLPLSLVPPPAAPHRRAKMQLRLAAPRASSKREPP